jgi:hypothetical protein
MSEQFFCDMCNQNITVHLFSDDDFYLEKFPNTKEELISHGKHSHWIGSHRICAICGQLVKSETLDLLVRTDYKGEIDKKYLDWEKDYDRGLLTVHESCMKS